MDYIVVTSKDTRNLQSDVQRHCAKGWEPLGYLQVVHRQANDERTFYQAMIKRDAEPVKPGSEPDNYCTCDTCGQRLMDNDKYLVCDHCGMRHKPDSEPNDEHSVTGSTDSNQVSVDYTGNVKVCLAHGYKECPLCKPR